MPAKVLSLKQDDFKGSDGNMVTCWKVELDDKTNPVPCYSGEAANLKIGEPLPDGWEVKVSKAGKDYLAVPKASKGGFGASSWYNSEAGVRFTQERMDRRTALMQAVELSKREGMQSTVMTWPESVAAVSDAFYEWLRASDTHTRAHLSGVGAGRETTTDSKPANVDGGGHTVDPLAGNTPPSRLPEVSSEPVGEAGFATPVEGGEAGVKDGGSSPASSSTTCVHEHTSPLRPDGTEMPINKVRCLDCGRAVSVAKV